MRLVLGIESSCDETAAALVTEGRRIVAQRIASQPLGNPIPIPAVIAAAVDEDQRRGFVISPVHIVESQALRHIAS